MDWKDLAKSFSAKGLEVIGGALLGSTGSQLGSSLASALGLKEDATPDQVDQALQSASPEQLVELKKIETDLAKRKLEHLETMRKIEADETTAQIGAVNTTMQAEAAQGHPWSGAWRPVWGFVSAACFAIAVIGIFVLAGWCIAKADAKLLAQIPTLIMWLVALFGIPGSILGVASWHRGQMQRIAAGETKPSILGTIQTVFNKGA